MFISRHLIATLGGDNDTVNKNSNDRMNSCCSRKVFGIPGDRVSLFGRCRYRHFETLEVSLRRYRLSGYFYPA